MLEDQILDQMTRSAKEPAAVLFRGGDKDRLHALVNRTLSLHDLDRDRVDVDTHFFALGGDEKSMGVETAREISTILARPPLRHPKRTVVVESAETLTMAAANALLKPIEELGKTSTHRVIFTALTTREWPSPLLSRFLIYDLHKHPLPSGTSKFSAILRQQSAELQSFWGIHEDTLYEFLGIVLKIRTTHLHEVQKRLGEMKVLEEAPQVFLTGVIQGMLHVDLYLRGRDEWKMAETYKDLAKSYGADYNQAMRARLIAEFVAIREWCGRAVMGSPQKHVIASVLQSKFYV